MASLLPPEPSAPALDAAQRRHDLGTTLTTLRLRTQSLQRLARKQAGDGWQRQEAGLAAIDADLSQLLCQLVQHDGD